METNRSLWPLLVILLLSLAVASFFWWPRSAGAPSFFEDVNTEKADSVSENKKETTVTKKPSLPVNSSEAGKRILSEGIYVTIIEYTKSGFAPRSLSVTAGEEIRFVNYSGGTMKIGTDILNTTIGYANYKQPNTVGSSGVFQIAVPTEGTWVYQNLNNPSATGTIKVVVKK
jgi:plastocyanin